MSKIIAPYGAWVSPVSVELMTEAAIGLSGLSVDRQDLYWLEARPNENGRTVLCRRRADGEIEDLTPPPFNVGSRVHEYGGGAYAVANSTIVVSERTDGSVWLIETGAAPRRIETPEGCRYADFEFDLPRRRVLAVREDHRARPPTDPKAAIVALPLGADGAETILVEGPDFMSSPRLAPGDERLAWIAWDHPGMPWDGTRLFVAGVTKEGALEALVTVSGNLQKAVALGLAQRHALFCPTGQAGGTSTPCVAPRSKPWRRSKPRSAVRIGFSASAITIFSPMADRRRDRPRRDRSAVLITGGRIAPLGIGRTGLSAPARRWLAISRRLRPRRLGQRKAKSGRRRAGRHTPRGPAVLGREHIARADRFRDPWRHRTWFGIRRRTAITNAPPANCRRSSCCRMAGRPA
jgi:hypothetical protein